ncbi:MAG: class I SAM-dependent methyltransferase, partial [Deltaproteobacteria bacterium]|nr:class I SAM-dependent methyltransferase [Deltaproteobacteria bacterium]
MSLQQPLKVGQSFRGVMDKDCQFRVMIKEIRRREKQAITGYWFNIIEAAGCRFLQGPIEGDVSKNMEDNGLALVAGKLHPEDIAGFWPEAAGYPLAGEEARPIIDYMAAQDGKDLELIVPLRNCARPVRWVNFEDSREYPIYAASIYPEILKAVQGISFRCILDVGCGSGNLLQAFRDRYPQACFYGVDISPDNVEAAGEKGFAHVCEGDAQSLDKLFGKEILFDLIIFCGVLNRQIMDAETASTILDKSIKLLTPGGHILITGYSSCHFTA